MDSEVIKILAIDDIPDNLISIKALITDAFPDARVLLAQSGKRGLEMATAENPDIILLDIIMPEMDGYEVCRQLKASTQLSDIPVVFITAMKGERESRIKALEVGAEAFLAKPIDETELIAQIRAMMKIRQANLKLRDEKAWLQTMVSNRTKELEKELRERLKTEKALQESEDRFRNLFEQAPLGYQSLNENGNFLQVNQAWSNTLGYSSDEVIGRWFGDFLSPEYVEAFRERFPIFKSQGYIHSEFWMIHKNGERLYIVFEGRISREPNGSFKQTHCILQDITTQKQAEIALRESEERFSKAFHTSPYALVISKIEDGKILEVNDTFCTISGYTRKEALASSSVLLDLWEDLNDRNKVIEALKKGESVTGRQINFRKKNGERLIGSVSSQILTLHHENSVLTSIEDITEKIRLVNQLEKQNQRYRIVSEKMSDFTFSCVTESGAYHIDWMAGAVKKVTGYTADEIIAETCWGFMVYSDDSEIFKKNVITLKPGHQSKCELRIVSPAGAIKWLEVDTVCMLSKDGNNHVLYGGCVDITHRKNTQLELKRNEERFRYVFESANVGKSMTEITGEINVNQAFCDMLGYEKDELQNKNWQDLTPVEEIDSVQNELLPLLNGEKNSARFKKRYIHKNGSYIWCDVSTVLHRDENGKPRHFITTVIDITERIKAENALYDSIGLLSMFISKSPIHAYIKAVTPTESRVLYASDNYDKMIGFKGSDMVGKTMFDLFPEEFAHKITNDDWLVVSNGVELKLDESLNGSDYITYKFPIAQGDASLLAGYTINITDRTQAEYALRESEGKYKSLVNQMQLGLALHEMIYDENGNPVDYRFLEINPGFEQITGLKRIEVIGKTVLEILPQTEKYWIENYGKVVKTGEPLYYENYSREIGKYYNVVAYKHAENQFAVVIEDITSRKKNEQAILQASENWKKTFHSMNSAIILLDANQNIIQSNQAFHELVGKTEEELKGRYCFHFVHENNCPLNECPFLRMKESRQREREEIKLNGRDCEIIIDPILNELGEITGAVHILNDITQRKLDENIQQILFEITRTSVSSTTLEELLKVVRNELHKVMDTTNFFVALHNPETNKLRKVIFEDEKDEFLEWDAEKSFSGQVVKLGKTVLLNRNESLKFGAEHNLELMGTSAECWLGVPLIIGEKTIGVIVVQSYNNEIAYNENSARILEMVANELSLVIERNNMISDLMVARDKAEESDLLKSAFLANMSHEIRTPMNGILGFTELLNDPHFSGEEKQNFIDIIQKSGQRMLNTVNDLIDISKIETGQMAVIYSEINIKNQLLNLYSFFKPEADEKRLRFVLNDQLDQAKAIIHSDEVKLDSILTNLIKNAIKYTDSGKVEIGCLAGDSKLEFYVKDTGIGIPLYRQSAVFNRFEQADIGDRRAYQGSGLGLTIAKAYVEMLGGTIELESEPGYGTTFRFFIPLEPVKESTTLKAKPEKSEEMEKPKRKLKILIAEDDPIGFQYLTALLREMHCDIYRADNGQEAVDECMKTDNIDIILMDIRMPLMDGYQATRKIREFNNEVYIIAQTAFALAGDKEKAIDAGCNEYISKPIMKDELMAIINRVFK